MNNAKLAIVVSILSGKRFSIFNEKTTQGEIEKVLTGQVQFEREKMLDRKSIIDFLVAGEVGLEVKISGSPKNIYRQCERYCKFPEIKYLVLVTAKSMSLPSLINNKPCFVLNISRSWL